MRVTGVALHTPTGLHHHHLQPPMGGFQVAPEPATGWQQPYQKHGGWQRSSDQSAREERLPMEGDEGAEEQHRASQQQQQQQQQQLETVGEKLSQLQRSLLAKQTYLAKASMMKFQSQIIPSNWSHCG